MIKGVLRASYSYGAFGSYEGVDCENYSRFSILYCVYNLIMSLFPRFLDFNSVPK